ncbi:MAG: transcriptional repressor NrdR [Firmicutes bacterium]|nr:transcriptional repressor NrdR [Bacillota bacterium]
MKCPFCGYEDTKVLDSRSAEDNSSIKRRRSCEKCSAKFTTYERVELLPLMVIKRDLSREPFDRNKILRGIRVSCNKRPIPTEDIENVVKEIENSLYNTGNREVLSSAIGQMVMEKLLDIDEVAYVRFVSVYRSFEDVDSFVGELEMLKERSGK